MIRYFILLVLLLSWLPLPVQAQACSAGSDETATLTFVNQTEAAIEIFWIDFDCVESSYGLIQPGNMAIFATYDRHEWRVRDANQEEIGYIYATGGQTLTLHIGLEVTPPTSASDFTYRPSAEARVPIEGAAGCVVRDVTPNLGLDPFYERYCDYEGVLIGGSSAVPDAAFHAAWNIMANMLQGQPEVVASFQEIGVKMGLVAQDEAITLLPEYAFLRDDPVINWDERSRGFGANVNVPLGSGAEENLLCYTSDPYLGESIFLHELAHTMKDVGIALLDPRFNAVLQLAYDNAVANGLWTDTYAMTNIDEYWAEGVQSYFNANLEASPSNGIHNEVNTRAELAAYDPTLFTIIDLIFGGLDWTPACPG